MATEPIICSQSKCNWPQCDCEDVYFSDDCKKGLPIVGHEDHEVIIGWTEAAFKDDQSEISDNDYPSLDRRQKERRSGLERREA